MPDHALLWLMVQAYSWIFIQCYQSGLLKHARIRMQRCDEEIGDNLSEIYDFQAT